MYRPLLGLCSFGTLKECSKVCLYLDWFVCETRNGPYTKTLPLIMKENDQEEQTNKLEVAIVGNDLSELATEYAEIGFDSFLDDGVLKEVPIVSTLVGIYKVGSRISQFYSTKKLYKFLFQLKGVDLKDRLEKIREINNSGKYASSVGGKLLEILDKVDSDNKPEIIGKLFRGVLMGQINYSTFLRVSHIVKNTFLEDIMWIKDNSDENFVYGSMTEEILLTTLTNTSTRKAKIPDDFEQELPKGASYLTETGRALIRFGFD